MIFNEMHRQNISTATLLANSCNHIMGISDLKKEIFLTQKTIRNPVSLPLFTTLTLKNIDYISHALNNALKIYV